MPRRPRADEAGGLYHALNRGNARQTIFRANQRGQDSLIVASVCGKLMKCQDDHVLMKLAGFTML